MYNIIYYCIERVSPRIYASVPAVVHRKNQRMQDLLLLDRSYSGMPLFIGRI